MIQTNLPESARPFSGNIFIDDDGMLWTGVSGGFVAFTPKSYVDKESRVTPDVLGLNPDGSGKFLVPVTVQKDKFYDGGLVASQAKDNRTIALRTTYGSIRIADGINQQDAVTLKQLQESESDFQNSGVIDVPAGAQSMAMLSSGVRVGGTSKQALVANSREAQISDQTERGFIIGSNESFLGGRRWNSGIIASNGANMETWVPSSGGIGGVSSKWNSVIIAAWNARMRPHVSYGLLTGQGTVSTGSATVTIGLYNIIDPDRSVTDLRKKTFVIGNGGNTEALERSNAFYVTHGGKAWVQNELEVDSPDGVVLRSPDGSRFRLQVDNNGNINTTKL